MLYTTYHFQILIRLITLLTQTFALSVSYSGIDDAIELIHKMGTGALLVKMESAFRLLPIWPGDFDLLGFMMDGLYYYDKCLPFGALVSCSLFEKVSTFIQWAWRMTNISKKKSTSNSSLHR